MSRPQRLGAVDVLIPALVISLFSTFLMFQTRAVADTMGGVDAVRALRGAVLIGILGLAAITSIVSNDIGWLKGATQSPLRWYALYAAWALASVSFSGDRFLSLAKVFELGVSFCVVLLINHWVRTPEQLDRIWRLTIMSLAMVACGYFVISLVQGIPIFVFINGIPKYQGFGGGPGGANGLTQIGAIIGLFGVSRSLTRGRFTAAYLAIVAVAVVLMLVSYSRTSIAIFVFLLAVLLVRSRQLVPAILVFAAGIVAVVAAGAALFEYALRGQDVATFTTLTGRIDFLWVAGFAVFLMSPIIGHGFYYGTTYLLPPLLFGTYDATISNVDNSFLEVAMNLGIVGLAIFVLLWAVVLRLLFEMLRPARKTWEVPMAREATLILLSTFLRSWINPTIVYHHWNTFLFLLSMIVLHRVLGEARRLECTPGPQHPLGSVGSGRSIATLGGQ